MANYSSVRKNQKYATGICVAGALINTAKKINIEFQLHGPFRFKIIQF